MSVIRPLGCGHEYNLDTALLSDRGQREKKTIECSDETNSEIIPPLTWFVGLEKWSRIASLDKGFTDDYDPDLSV